MQNLPLAVFDCAVLWLWVWPLRKRGEFDIPLDGLGRDVRWISVFLFAVLAGKLPGPRDPAGTPDLIAAVDLIRYAPASAICAFAFIAFMVWPNCGYRLTTALRWARILPPASPEYARKLRIFWGRPTDEDLEADRLEQQAIASGHEEAKP